MAKSFILIADTYPTKGNKLLAKNMLESVIENYEEYDDIIPSTKERLKKLKLRKLIDELRQTLKKSIEIIFLIQFKFLFQTIFCHADTFGCNI